MRKKTIYTIYSSPLQHFKRLLGISDWVKDQFMEAHKKKKVWKCVRMKWKEEEPK